MIFCAPGQEAFAIIQAPSGATYTADGNGLALVADRADFVSLIAAGWQPVGNSPVKRIAGTDYPLSVADNGAILVFSNAAAVTLTVQPGLSFGFTCGVVQAGAGKVTPTPGEGVTIHNRQSQTGTAGQYAFTSLVAISDDNFILSGDTV